MNTNSPQRAVIAAALASSLAIVTGIGTAQAANPHEDVRITFVRHGESYGNTSQVINTSIPGPVLTEVGHQQAKEIAAEVAGRDVDAVYASVMPRAQQTAQYLADELSQTVQVIPGVEEIQFGLDGMTHDQAGQTLFTVMGSWLDGNLNECFDAPGECGTEFQSRFNDALAAIHKSRNKNSVVYAHSASVMIGTLLNDPSHDLDIWGEDTLRNTGIVTLEGSPRNGWSIVEWNGEPLPAE
ncbi:histidine phosphatase family protein [Hoyosella altamirensis]|uniref:Broad specificity phosphatase PhoE n=1 Tax=Hoyosella altamirensis TaxID=616997 RepID=A0A839RTL7_9ACTN|nr:histidine phosphatase family protein [Hoyosella altamirensis]MBB3039243.1 broad specificity phosphatase PhoE [Hoyosella altamirensis]